MALLRQMVSKGGPNLAVLGREDADGALGDLVDGGLVGVVDDGSEIREDVSLSERGTVLGIEDVEPV